MPAVSITLDEALDLTRTGDVWLFRGHAVADRAIQVATNSPVNHVGMSVVVDDLPPLMWHAELGRSLPDLWSGTRHRGVQLHDLRDAVIVWANRYGQRAWRRRAGARPSSHRDASRAVDGKGVPSSRAIVRRTASSISRVAGGSSWRSHARWPYRADQITTESRRSWSWTPRWRPRLRKRPVPAS